MAAVSAAKRFRLTPPVVLEHPLQKQLADVLRLEIAAAGKVSKAGVVWWSLDAADYGGSVPGIRIGRGLIAGVPDIFITHHGRAFFVEIKTAAADSELSIAQQSVCAALLISGGRVGVVRDVAELLVCIDEWKIPRAGRIRL